MALIKNEHDLKLMRESGKITAAVILYLVDQVKPGITTNEINKLAAQETKKLGGIPAFLHYKGFPKSICVSVNSAVVHGIPGEYAILPGDVVSMDFGVSLKGLITDAATTVIMPSDKPNPRIIELVEATKESLYSGIDVIKHGVRIGDISAVIEKRLRQSNLGIVEELVGHGVGYKVHEPPEIPNFGHAGTGPVLKTGMTIAIEPMATLGQKDVTVGSDGWTVETRDSSLAAHFEHTVLVTDNGAEILTIH